MHDPCGWVCLHCSADNAAMHVVCNVCGRYTDPSQARLQDTNPTGPPAETQAGGSQTACGVPQQQQHYTTEPDTHISPSTTASSTWRCEGCSTEHAIHIEDCCVCGSERPEGVAVPPAQQGHGEGQETKDGGGAPPRGETGTRAYDSTRFAAMRDPTEGVRQPSLELDDDLADEDVLFPCDVCKRMMSARLLGDHLAGHFAAEALPGLVSSEGDDDGPGSDRSLARMLQEEEMERFLGDLQQRAMDRVLALQIGGAGVGAKGGKKGGGGGDGEAQEEKRKVRRVFEDVPEVVAPNRLRIWRGNKERAGGEARLRHAELVLADLITREVTKGGESGVRQLSQGPEYLLVADFLVSTLVGMSTRRSRVAIIEIQKWVHPLRFDQYRKTSRETEQNVMFHGCRTLGNEESIRGNGFLVQKCVSGGSNFGTWFAFNAAYSNGGFVYRDPTSGVARILICLVSRSRIKLENSTMRVVGQDCAYPAYCVAYRDG